MEELKKAVEMHQQGNLREAANICRQVLEQEPDNVNAMHLLGIMEQENGQSQAAIDLFTRALEKNPEDPILYNNLAATFMSLGELEQAEKQLQKALDIDGTQAESYSNLGRLQYRLGKLDDAEKNLQLALRVRPDYPLALNTRGLVELRQGKVEQAIKTLKKSIEVDPDIPDSHLSLGKALQRQDAPGLAIQCFENALELQGDYLEAQIALAGAQMQACLMDAASATLRKALKHNPNRPEPSVAVGDLFRIQGNFSEALQRYERAVRLQPSFAEGYLAAAELLREIGETMEASALLRDAVRLAPDQIDAQTMLAECLIEEGDTDTAASHVVTALEFEPLHALANVAHARISAARGATDQGLKQLEALLKHALARGDRTAALMARAQLLDSQGEHAAAFEAARQGNEQLRGESPRPLAPETRPLDEETLLRLREWAAAEPFEEYPEPPDDGRPEARVMVDFPFSGGDVVRRLLNEQKKLHLFRLGGTLDGLWREFVADPEQLQRLKFVGATQESRQRRQYWRTIRQHLPQGIEQEKVIDWTGLRGPLVGPLHRFFPQMKVLFLLRDPRDVVLDAFMNNRRWHPLMPMFIDVETAARSYADYMDTVCAYRDRLPDMFHTIQFEQFLKDPQQGLSTAGEWLGYEELSIDKDLMPVIDRARKQSSRWQNYAEQLQPAADILAPLVERFGYGD
ncbi:MAG: tetratricopeptide repeat protein [Gammaproteobacteria bacterium]|nr:MAG: tetratricopeptide repeat protein [Gammaproteobacteria bacterium]